MSYTAPQFYGYGPAAGGYAQFFNGRTGKTYNSKRQTTQHTGHQLARRNPKQNKPQNGDTSYEGSGTGSVMGVVLNEIRIDQHEKVMATPVDPMGPKTDRPPASYGHMGGGPKMTINKTY